MNSSARSIGASGSEAKKVSGPSLLSVLRRILVTEADTPSNAPLVAGPPGHSSTHRLVGVVYAMERNDSVIRLLWTGSVLTRSFLRRYMPTNILLDAIRTPRGLKWGVPAMLLAIPYFWIAAILVQVINDGGLAWLNVLILLSIWNGLKMLWIGPLSLMLLARILRRRVYWRIAVSRSASPRIA